MRRPAARLALLVALAVLAAAPPATSAAGEPKTAADVTEPGRRMERALDVILDARGRVDGPRTLLFVIDASASLKGSGFADKLEAAIERNAPRLGATSIGIAGVGERARKGIAPTADLRAVAAGVRDLMAGARNALANVYADVREGAGALCGKPGAHELALVTLENGDAEDDVEATAAALARAKARAFVVAREAFLSDSYWQSRITGKAPPKGTSLTGGDAAFTDVPWGWIFQGTNGNEVASSGFATWGLTRLASATGGRVFLVTDGATGGHQCTHLGTCEFCTLNDHQPPDEVTQSGRVKALAPLAESRDDVLAAAAKDPGFRAMLSAWKAAAKEGLVRSRPSVELSGSTLVPQKRTLGAVAELYGTGVSLSHAAMGAKRAEEAATRILADLDADLARSKDGEGVPRWRASAEYVRAMLHLTRLNLVQLQGWASEAGPAIMGKKPFEPVPPETAPVAEGLHVVGFSCMNMVLCHGVRPFREMRLPGGDGLRAAFDALERAADGYTARYAGTPFLIAFRRSGIAKFVVLVQGKPLPPPERRPPGTQGEPPPATPSDRPVRDPGSGTSEGGAPTTGG